MKSSRPILVFESCIGNALALSPASGHYLKYYNHISVFIYLHVGTIYMNWYPRSWPMSQSFCTPPDPSLQSENFCQGNSELNLDRRFYVHHTAEHIRTWCFMTVCPKIKEYCKNVFRGICKWMPAYERVNIEVIIHVLHQSCNFSATLTVPLQTRSSKWPPRRRMHCSARALKLTLARLHNATAQTRRENDTNEVCDGIL